jgi:hypothetical protein
MAGIYTPAHSQVYPISSTTTLTPPYPIFLKDFYAASNTSMRTTLINNDLQRAVFDVKIKVRLESNNVKIETKDGFIPLSPISLTAGLPTLLQSTDFEPYLNPANIEVSGVDPTVFLQSGGKLPEGFYQICVTVYDYRTGIQISQAGCAMVNIFQEQPPRLMKPECEKMVAPTIPQSVLFSWQPAPGGSPTLTATSQYTLSIWKILDPDADGFAAVQNGQTMRVYESFPMFQSTFNLDLTTTQLDIGHRYAYQVQATDANGLDVYANNGRSEFCWFYYGFPSGGKIELKTPANGVVIRKNDERLFSWGGTDKGTSNQPYEYVLKIVKVKDNQTPEDALRRNPSWYETRTSETRSDKGGNLELPQEIEPQAHYAWQVSAYSGTQEVALSNVFDFFGPPVLEEFYAGNFVVRIKSTENTDLKSLKGVGLVQLSPDPTDIYEVPFDKFTLEEISGEMFLTKGEALFDLTERKAQKLLSTDDNNPDAKFIYKTGKLNPQGLKVKGEIEWPLPLPVKGGQAAKVISDTAWYTLNDKSELNGFGPIAEEGNRFTLLDPLDHILEFKKPSKFKVANNVFVLGINGVLELPKKLRTNDGEAYKLYFEDKTNLTYFEVDYLLANSANYLTPIPNSTFAIKPKKAIIDLSESKSPGQFSGNKSWKGIYIPEFKAVIPIDFGLPQFALYYEHEFDEKLDGSESELWLTSQGVRFKYHFEVLNDPQCKFNGFPTPMIGDLLIDKNELKDSKLAGYILIPFIDENKKWTFSIPINEDGIAEGFLDEKVEGTRFKYNAYGGENLTNMELKRAVFADNERLDCQLSAEIPELAVNFGTLDSFMIYGDNFIGFGARNQSVKLDQPISGKYKTYPLTISEVGAGFSRGTYGFSWRAEIDMGKDVAGAQKETEKGKEPPKAGEEQYGPVVGDFSSVKSLPQKFCPTNTNAASPSAIYFSDELKSSKKISSNKMEINIKTSTVDVSGTASLVENHPEFENIFTGTVSGKILQPIEFDCGATIVVGKTTDGIDFWYFDTYFNDKEGTGIPFITPFNLTAFEGRLFKKMSIQGEGANRKFKPDRNNEYGLGIYMQLIEAKSLGRNLVMDVAAELNITKDNYTINMKGDLSALNSRTRSSAPGAQVIGKAVAKEVAKELMKQLGPLEWTVGVGGGNLHLLAETPMKGKIDYTKGDFYTEIGVDLEQSVPGGSLKFNKGDYKMDLKGDATGLTEVGLDISGTKIGAGFTPPSAGFLNFDYSGFSLYSSFDKLQKAGAFRIGYQGDSLIASANASNNLGELLFKYDGNKVFGKYDKGAAKLGFERTGTKISLSGDPSTQVGAFELEVNSVAIAAGLDAKQGKGNFKIDTPELLFDLSGEKAGKGNLKLKSGEFDLKTNLDITAKTAAFSLLKGKNTTFEGKIDQDLASLKLIKDETSFGLSGDLAGTKGGIFYKDASISLAANADKTSMTGDFLFEKDGIKVKAGVVTDSAYASYADSDINAQVAGYGPKSGRVFLETQGYTTMLKYVDAKKYGQIYLSDGTRILKGYGDGINMEGDFLLTDGDKLYAAVHNADTSGLKIKHDKYLLSGGRNTNGNHHLLLSDNQNEIYAFANIKNKSGEFRLNTGAIKASGFANLNNKSFRVSYEDADMKHFASHLGENSSFNSEVKGDKIYADKKAADYSAGFDISGNKLDASYIGSGQNAFVSFEGSGVVFGFSKNDSETKLNFKKENDFVNFDMQSGGAVNLSAAMGGNTVEGRLNSGVKKLLLKGEGYNVFAVDSASLRIIDLSKGAARVYGSTQKELYINTGNHNVLATAKEGPMKLFVDGEEAKIDPVQSFEFDGIKIEIIKLKANIGNISVEIPGIPKLNLNFDADWNIGMGLKLGSLDFSCFTLPAGFGIKLGEMGLSLDLSKPEFPVADLNFSTNLNLKTGVNLSDLNLDLKLKIPDVEMGIITSGLKINGDLSALSKKIAFSYDLPSDVFGFGFEKINFKFGKELLGLSLSETQFINLTPNLGELKFGDISLKTDLSTDLRFEMPDWKAGFSASGLEIMQDLRKLNIEFGDAPSLKLNLNTDFGIGISGDLISASFEDKSLNIEPGKLFSYIDGPRKFELGVSGLNLIEGDLSLGVDAESFGLSLGTDLNIDLSKTAFMAKYGDINVDLKLGESLSFTDGIRSFSLGSTEIKLSSDGIDMSVFNFDGITGIDLGFDAHKLKISNAGFDINFENRIKALSGFGKIFDVKYDEFNFSLAENMLILKEPNYNIDFKIGGDYWLYLTAAGVNFGITTTPELFAQFDKFSAYLAPDLSARLNYDEYRVELFKNGIQAGFYYKDLAIKLPEVSQPNMFKILANYGDYAGSLECMKDEFVKFGGLAEWGEVKFGYDVNSTFIGEYLKGNRKIKLELSEAGGIMYSDSEQSGIEDPKDLKETPPVDGPQHNKEKISSTAGGRITGDGSMYYNSANKKFTATAKVKSSEMPCLSGAFAFESTPDYWDLKVGTPQQRVVVKPLCGHGFEGDGYLFLDSKSNLELGVRAGWRDGGGCSIGTSGCDAGLSCEAKASLGIVAKMELNPIEILKAKVEVSVSAGVDAEYDCGVSGSCTIARVSMSGSLDADFRGSAVKVNGTLRGSIEVLDLLDESFSMGFSGTF